MFFFLRRAKFIAYVVFPPVIVLTPRGETQALVWKWSKTTIIQVGFVIILSVWQCKLFKIRKIQRDNYCYSCHRRLATRHNRCPHSRRFESHSWSSHICQAIIFPAHTISDGLGLGCTRTGGSNAGTALQNVGWTNARNNPRGVCAT